MRANPVVFENSGFSKKPGKRRLARSTQFSRNRAPGDSHRRTPRRTSGATETSILETDPSVYGFIGLFQQLFSRAVVLPETDDSAENEPLERTNPCGGTGI